MTATPGTPLIAAPVLLKSQSCATISSLAYHLRHVQVHEDHVEGIRAASVLDCPQRLLAVGRSGDVGVADALQDAQSHLRGMSKRKRLAACE
jgi:hypothetical protein